MSSIPPITEACLHTPNGDFPSYTPHHIHHTSLCPITQPTSSSHHTSMHPHITPSPPQPDPITPSESMPPTTQHNYLPTMPTPCPTHDYTIPTSQPTSHTTHIPPHNSPTSSDTSSSTTISTDHLTTLHPRETTNIMLPPSPIVSPNPQNYYGYTPLPLPALAPTDLQLISHNINTLHTMTTAELGATFDSYATLNPTIIGLQETNKNWSLYKKTEGPLWNVIN